MSDLEVAHIVVLSSPKVPLWYNAELPGTSDDLAVIVVAGYGVQSRA